MERQIRQPSNPVTCFVSGNDTEEFRFEPGSRQYYLSLLQDGAVQFSMLLWADSPEHVREIVRQARDFTAGCLEKYRSQHPEVHARQEHSLAKWDRLVRALELGHAVVAECPRNQFFKVGWAHNDVV